MSKQEEIKQALAAATPGPWKAKDDSVQVGESWICQMYEGEYDCECDYNDFPNAERNAYFIAKAPEYIAYLLEENERLRKELEEAQREAQQWRSKYDSKHALLVMTDTSRNEKDRMYREALEAANRYQQELEEERKRTEAVRRVMQDVLYYLQRDSYIPAQDILEQYLAMGQEGEGNQCK